MATNPYKRVNRQWYRVPIGDFGKYYSNVTFNYHGKPGLSGKSLYNLQLKKGASHVLLEGVLPEHKDKYEMVDDWVWVDKNGKLIDPKLAEKLEALYNTADQPLQEIYKDTNNGVLGGTDVIDKNDENYDEYRRLKNELEFALDQSVNPNGKLFDYNQPATMNYISQQALKDAGFNFTDRYFTGAGYDKNYYKNLRSLDNDYNALSLGLMAPAAVFLAPEMAAVGSGLSAFANTAVGNMIGNIAGSMAIGQGLEMAERGLFGQSVGDKVVNLLLLWGVNPFVSEMFRPEYWINPTGALTSKVTSKIGLADPMKMFTNVGVDNSIARGAIHGPSYTPWWYTKEYYNNIKNRFTEDGFVIGDNAYKLQMPTNTLYSGVPVPNVVKTPIGQLWLLEHLPGYLLKSLMSGSPLEKSVNKNGLININSINAVLKNSSAVDQEIINKVINKLFAGQTQIPYNDLRKAVQNELITYSRKPTDLYSTYGMDNIGYNADFLSLDVEFDPIVGFKYGNVPKIKPFTYTFESSRLPHGNDTHYDKSTLGHVRTFTTSDLPGVLYVLESQSDWAQARTPNNPIDLKKVNELKKFIKSHKEGIAYYLKLMKKEKDPEVIDFFNLEILDMKKDIDEFTSELQLILNTDNYMLDPAHYNYLQKEYIRKLLLENMKYAAENGHTKMRYPTRETAAKIEGYPQAKMPNDMTKVWPNRVVQYAKTVKVSPYTDRKYFLNSWLKAETDPLYISKYQQQLKNIELLEQRWFNGETTYMPEYEGILNKYSSFPKLYQKTFKGQSPTIVTDSKGNTWYEVDVPENFLDLELLYKKGGQIKLRFI